MLRRLRPLAALALVGAVLSVAGLGSLAAPAAAACAHPDTATAIGNAQAVFTGVAGAGTANGAAFHTPIAVDRIFKGDVAASVVQVRTRAGSCGLGALTEGSTYVLMVTAKGGQLVASGASGTALATDALMAEVQAALGEGTPLNAEPATPEVDFQLVGDATPTPALRAAAPGIALALAGLLGWFLVRRRFA
ncbi:MAG: hypothetical protein QM572_10305 [Nocardioides sp.]|uniref:hypothetical protein n=1 Tax=Nocardioides sp. TaxID=35761 RepID=UPI0039E447D5